MVGQVLYANNSRARPFHLFKVLPHHICMAVTTEDNMFGSKVIRTCPHIFTTAEQSKRGFGEAGATNEYCLPIRSLYLYEVGCSP